ncbi:MAG: AraC family transcriptional regulator [Clostridiales bacterium]|nr:AraC family transcriptional regulator [Clostridiales bacterium]MDD7035543.1 AraC family transcriptional regulator [Bacillota bacterium]MDY2919873.1 AraC family transcriptional regulator [Lentihominibacter sp.]
MKLDNYNLTFKKNLPFHAELLHITKLLPHRHEKELELIFCLEGSVNMEAADQKYTLTAGQIHSIDYDDVHRIWSDCENTILIFHMDLSAFDDWDKTCNMLFSCESNHLFPYQEKPMADVKDIILSLSYEFFTDCPSPELYYKPLRRLLDIIIQYFNWFNYENQDNYMNPELYERFHRVLEYCLDNYRNKISISNIAREENINRNYFSQFIGKTVFSSFSKMISYIRCYYAERLLLETSMPNSEISFECGFSDPKYFYASFKDMWGRTPTEHRKIYLDYYRECLKIKGGTTAELFSDSDAASYIKDYIGRWHQEKILTML